MNWKTISYLTVVAVVSGVLFSCYKSKNFSTNETAQIDSAIIVQSYDQVRVAAVIDEVFNDVNKALSSQNAVTGAGISADTTLCNVQLLLDTSVSPNYISLTYGGASCDNSHALSGNVTIYFTPGTQWKNQFDTIGVNINKLTVAGLQSDIDTNTIRLNGIFYYANTSGGMLSSLTAGSAPITHVILSPYLGVIFNSADTATWQVARKRSYKDTAGGIVISTTGIDTVSGILNVSEWGGNRYGNSFITAIDTALVTTAGCGYQVTSGQIQMTNPSGLTTINFGLNASGVAATGCPASGSYYYFHFSWTGSDSNPYSSVRPYPYY
jgi:hypothetical protein